MKMKLVTIISVLVVTFLSLLIANTSVAQGKAGYEPSGRPPSNAMTPSSGSQASGLKGAGGADMATSISPEEAAKKYPALKGVYPAGESDPHKPSGQISSPYPPHQAYDCSKIAHGGLVLDTRVKKVFVRP